MVPSARIQRAKDVIDKAHNGCLRIFEEKKAALKRGDQEMMHMVGEGKDVMSVLCEHPRALSNPFLADCMHSEGKRARSEGRQAT